MERSIRHKLAARYWNPEFVRELNWRFTQGITRFHMILKGVNGKSGNSHFGREDFKTLSAGELQC